MLRPARPSSKQIAQWAHWLVVATAAALPWSTSAVSILLALWLCAALASFNWKAAREQATQPIVLLPAALFLFAFLGTFWSHALAIERWQALVSFARLLVIPLLVLQYRRRGRGSDVFLAFLFSCSILLIVSWVTFWMHLSDEPGVPVKSYIVQSLEFVICATVLIEWTVRNYNAQKREITISLLAWAFMFLANVAFVATARTTLVVLVAIVLVYGFRRAGWKGAVLAALVATVSGTVVWQTSPYIRDRVLGAFTEVRAAEQGAVSSSGLRLVFWRKSVEFIEQSPLLGNGTGAIAEFERQAKPANGGPESVAMSNPHNQSLAVGIQLGAIGVALLWSMWISQILLFRHADEISWIGTVFVIQNLVGSLFNTLIFDFTEGWLYVLGVGIAGGLVLRLHAPNRDAPLAAPLCRPNEAASS